MKNHWDIGIEIDPKKKEVLFDIALETKFELTLPHVSVHVKGFEPRFSNKTHFKIKIGLKNSEPE